MIHVMPADGVKLTQANGTPVPADGGNYKKSAWWKRRERDGDAIITRATAAKAKPKPTKSQKQKGSDA